MNIKKLSVELLLCPQQTESHLKHICFFIHTLMFLSYITIFIWVYKGLSSRVVTIEHIVM